MEAEGGTTIRVKQNFCAIITSPSFMLMTSTSRVSRVEKGWRGGGVSILFHLSIAMYLRIIHQFFRLGERNGETTLLYEKYSVKNRESSTSKYTMETGKQKDHPQHQKTAPAGIKEAFSAKITTYLVNGTDIISVQ